jgi:uncharacterized membrane-anchored protein
MSAAWAHAQEGGQVAAPDTTFQTRLQALPWVNGPASVPIFGRSTLKLPEGYMFLDAAGTVNLGVLAHLSVSDGHAVTLAPRSLRWFASVVFRGDGLVKDSDASFDESAVLGELRREARWANKERSRSGLLPVTPTAWVTPPAYDSAAKRLTWAALYQSPGEQVVHFTMEILGRHGVAQVVLLTPVAEEREATLQLTGLLAGYAWNSGESYDDWQPGDPVASYSLADLVIGRTGIVLPPQLALFQIVLILIALVFLLVLVFLLYWGVPRLIRKGLEYLKERYTTLAAEQKAATDKGAAAEQSAAKEGAAKEPRKEGRAAARPTPASELEQSLVLRSERAKVAMRAGIFKAPLLSLIVAGVVLFTIKHAAGMDIAILLLFGAFLAARGFSIPASMDAANAARTTRICAALSYALAPVMLGLCAVVVMQAVFSIADHDSQSIRAVENHLSYLIQSRAWGAYSIAAAVALCTGLAALIILGATLGAAGRSPILRKALVALFGIIAWAGTFTCFSQVPIRGEDSEEARALETRRKAEGEETQKAARQVIYLVVQNLSPEDARYYRVLFVELNDTEPYPEHAKLLQALVADKMSRADAAGSENAGKLQKSDIAEALEHPDSTEESLAVVQDLFCRQIGAESVETRGLAGKLIEQLVDTEARELFSGEVRPVNPDQIREIALAEARKNLSVLAVEKGSAVDVEQVRIEVEKAAKEVKEKEERKERKEKLKERLKEKLGGEEKEKGK